MTTLRPCGLARQLRHFCVVLSLSFALGAVPAFAATCNGSTQNKAKISQAGMNTVFQEGGSVTLNANLSGSNPAPPTGIYSWSQVSGPTVTLTPTAGISSAFTVPHVTTGHSAVLVLRLTVTGATCTGAVPSTDDISINLANINNFPPVAVATVSAASVSPGTQVFLYSLGSYDPDNDPIVFSWTQTQGPAVTIVGSNTATASFVAPALASTTTFRFRLKAAEDLPSGLFGLATVDVNVVVANSPPSAQLGCPTAIGEGQTITLDGSASTDPESGPLTYAFSQLSGYPLATIPPVPHGSSVSFPAPALGPGEPGLVQFGLTVTDNGNASSSANCSFFIMDVTAPVLSGNVDLVEEATSPDGASASYTINAFDNVDGASLATCNPVSGSTFPLGETTVNCSKTDSSLPANTGYASFKVTVVDTTAPVIDSHSDETAEATSSAGAIVSYFSPATSDAYDGAGTATCSPASGSQFAVGSTAVTCNATDSNSNPAAATSFNVIVKDETAPVITAPLDQTFEATGPLTALTTADYGAATATDAVGVDFESNDAPAQFPLGKTTITWYARDAANNSSEASTVITIVDTTAPALTVPADFSVEATGPSGAVVTFSTSAVDLVDTDVEIVCAPASGDTLALGAHLVSCTATDDSGNQDSGSFTVTVEDTTAPTLTVPADFFVEATGPSGAVVSFSATAVDLVDTSVDVVCTPASGSTLALGAHLVSCTATDDSGNQDNGSFTVTVRDTTPPVIAPHADVTAIATSAAGAVASYALPTASDLVDGAVTVVCTPASGSTFAVGTTAVNCSATDSHNNTSTSTFNVIVSYNFTGFFRPIDNLPIVNVVKAGQAIPVKFSLGGNMGLAIMTAGYPRSVVMACSGGLTDTVEETLTAGSSSLSYDPTTGQYIYVWKSEKSWAGTCRQLQVKLADGTSHFANFSFTR